MIKKQILKRIMSRGLCGILVGFICSTSPAQPSTASDWQSHQQQATTLYEAGQYAAALKHAQQALSVAEKNSGQTAPYIASSLNIIAMIYDAQGDSAQAVTTLQRAIALFRQSRDAQLNTATLLYNLAGFYQKQQRSDLALASLKEADQLLQTLHSERRRPELLILQSKLLSDLQRLSIQLGQTDAAAAYAQRQYDALSVVPSQALSAAQSLSYIRSLMGLLQSYQQQQKSVQADQVLAAIMQRFEQLKTQLKPEQWQDDYAAVLELTLQNTAPGQARKAAQLEAIRFYQPLVAHNRAYAARLAYHYNELGFAEFTQKNFSEAEQWFQKSAAPMQQAYGLESIQYARLLGNFALLKEQQSAFKSALEYHQQIQELCAKLLGVQGLSDKQVFDLKQAYVQSLNNTAVIQFKQTEFKTAERAWQQALGLLNLTEPNQAALALPILENLQRAYLQQRRSSEERAVREKINQIQQLLASATTQ
jgi:tetratricopeptide (TPR) repeat protein